MSGLEEVKKAARRVERERKAAGIEDDKAGTLLPTEQTTAAAAGPTAEIIAPRADEHVESEAEEEARMFARLKQMSGPKDQDEDEAADEQASEAADEETNAPGAADEPAAEAEAEPVAGDDADKS